MKKIKISPSTKTGSHHWLWQRISALALIPLIIWLAVSFVLIIQDVEANMAVFFAYPFNAVMSILLIVVSLYHGSLGMQVIFEDYVSCKFSRRILIICIHFLSITTAIAAILAVLRLHLIG
ncbi:MAG TPA: succinate dehydrogenase, hydrophobic membrane anchor protein [Rickettsiales bacterium]|nr:succinate dehydrogenase, hydrophobic membrane anchor protein [Rickettsiales bacterium]